MAYTRKAIRDAAKDCDVEMPKELIEVLMNLHLEARDAYAEAQVEAALKNNPQTGEALENGSNPEKVEDTDAYKALKKQFEDYKAEQTAKDAKAAKEAAAQAYFESKNIKDTALRLAMRSSSAEIDALELEGGKIKDTKALDDLIAGDLSGLVRTETTTGVRTATPPNTGNNTTTKTREEIRSIKDTATRLAEMQKNPALFGIT